MIDKMCNTIVNDKVKSVYSFNDYSIQDLLSKFFEQINSITDLVNQNEGKINTQNFKLEEFINYMKNEGIPPIVIETVAAMYNDGRLTELFNTLANNVIDKVEEFKTQVNSQLEQIETQKVDKIELEVERNRIDLLTHIQNGETQGNAELLDIRNGANGKVYNGAGVSVREQIKESNLKLKKFKDDLGNSIYSKDNVNYNLLNNIGYDISSGNISQLASTYMKSTIIDVNPFENYLITTTSGSNWWGYLITDINGKILTSDLKQSEWKTYSDLEIEIPTEGRKLYINCNASYAITVKKINVLPIATKFELQDKNYKYTIPSYYKEHLDNKITEIQKLEMESGLNGATYTFITDMHVNANALNSFSLLERVKGNTNAYHCFYGGDSCRAFGNEDYLRTDNETIMSGLYNVFGKDISYVLGNHDYTICTGSTWGQDMKSVSTNAMYAIYNKKTGVTTKRLYHYWDDIENKIRHIIIDYTSINLPWFLKWFEETIKTTEEGWGLCFYTHVNMFKPNGEIGTEINYTNIINWICAIKNKTLFNATIKSGDFSHTVNVDYTNSKLDVIYVIWGHMHEDYATVYNNVNFICTTCDATYNDDADVPRSKGTITEQAFDVIHINTNTKKVNFIRIGAGNSRDFTY